MKKIILVLSMFLIPFLLKAQQEGEEKASLSFSGYADTYYAWFSDSVGRNQLQEVTTVAPRSRQFGLNVAQLAAVYASEKVRGTIIFSYGDIAIATWSEEFPFIQEANVGIRLVDNWWLDAGFFATHIGTESFLPKNNLLSSTAVATYNEPFYQAGAKLSFEGNEKLDAQLWVVNGYNYFLDFNRAKSAGLYLSYAFSDELSLSYTNLLGNEAPYGADVVQFRVYQNMYVNAEMNGWHFIFGGDVGTQTNTGNKGGIEEQETAIMYNALATVRYQFNPHFSVTGRGEVFQDKSGFISGRYPGADNRQEGLQLYGFTAGTEFRPADNAYLRLEARYLKADDSLEVFTLHGKPEESRWEVLATMGFTFDKLLQF